MVEELAWLRFCTIAILLHPLRNSTTENLSLLEEVRQLVTATDIGILNSKEPHRLPKALRAQMISYTIIARRVIVL